MVFAACLRFWNLSNFLKPQKLKMLNDFTSFASFANKKFERFLRVFQFLNKHFPKPFQNIFSPNNSPNTQNKASRTSASPSNFHTKQRSRWPKQIKQFQFHKASLSCPFLEPKIERCQQIGAGSWTNRKWRKPSEKLEKLEFEKSGIFMLR